MIDLAMKSVGPFQRPQLTKKDLIQYTTMSSNRENTLLGTIRIIFLEFIYFFK